MPDSSHSRRDFLKTTGAGLLVAAGPATQLAPPDKQPPDLKLPPAKPKQVGYAIVGLGELALGEIMPAFRHSKLSRPVALVSGHPEKAKDVAAAYEVDPKRIYSYDNFDTIRDNPEIEAVYIVLPNSMHAEYTARAFKAGKHVLCEKPMATSVEECQRMIDAGKEANRKLMIAYRLQYEPFNRTAIEICRNKEFGKVISIEACNMQDTKAPNIRLSKQTGGGPLGDIGIYCINACRYLTGEEPVEVTAQAYRPADEPRFAEVDRDVVFSMRFPSGATASCGVSFGSGESRRYRVHFSEGWMELDPAFSYRGLRMHTSSAKKKERAERQINEANHFASEMDHFSDCVQHDKQPLTPGEEGLADMRIIAALQEAIRSGQTQKLSGSKA